MHFEETVLRIACCVQIANFDGEGRASVAHTDITPGQFILVDGKYKLNDFNRARLIRWDKEKNEPCGFHVGNNPGKVSDAVFLFLILFTATV